MEYSLKKGEVMSLAASAGHVIRVSEGFLWLTRSEDSRDYILNRGESLFMDSNVSLVLEALTDCSLAIACPHAAPLRVTIQVLLPGELRGGQA